MTHFKDIFSKQAETYARFRPTYPPELYDFLLGQVKTKEVAWDCGTGNGQVAVVLAESFEKVYATDPTKSQIENAFPHPKVTYSISTAEKSGLPDHSVDLVTVAQAIHWFRFEEFYAEIRRVTKKDALLAVWGYGLSEIEPEIDSLIFALYADVLGDTYWEKERKHIENRYQSIPFPYETLTHPVFYMKKMWTPEHLIGYLNSWSSVQKYIQINKFNPVADFEEKLLKTWGDPVQAKEVKWELIMKLGKI